MGVLRKTTTTTITPPALRTSRDIFGGMNMWKKRTRLQMVPEVVPEVVPDRVACVSGVASSGGVICAPQFQKISFKSSGTTFAPPISSILSSKNSANLRAPSSGTTLGTTPCPHPFHVRAPHRAPFSGVTFGHHFFGHQMRIGLASTRHCWIFMSFLSCADDLIEEASRFFCFHGCDVS